MELPRRFEITDRYGEDFYIVDLDRETLAISPKDPEYEDWKHRVWHDYTEGQVARYIKDGVWIITEDLTIEENPVEVGDLL